MAAANGKLSTYSQVINSRQLSGADIVERVAQDSSVNPGFLLAFIEFRSHWVLGSRGTPDMTYPLDLEIPNNEGLYLELSIAANLLNVGYYGWREGTMTQLTFMDYRSVRIAPPELNAGTVAIQYLFARMLAQSSWEEALYGANGFLATYLNMFGDARACARSAEPLFPQEMQLPNLELPFAPGEAWALTGGLHSDWITGTPLGALDFAPVTGEAALCRLTSLGPAPAAGPGWSRVPSEACSNWRWWMRPGILPAGSCSTCTLLKKIAFLREQWSSRMMRSVSSLLREGGQLQGRMSIWLACTTGNGLVQVAALFPFILSGWLTVPGKSAYHSSLVKGDRVVTSDINGSGSAIIIR